MTFCSSRSKPRKRDWRYTKSCSTWCATFRSSSKNTRASRSLKRKCIWAKSTRCCASPATSRGSKKNRAPSPSADQSGDNCLRKPLAEADGQTIAVKFDVCGLDDVLGFDHHRGNSFALYLRFCPSGG